MKQLHFIMVPTRVINLTHDLNYLMRTFAVEVTRHLVVQDQLRGMAWANIRSL